MNRFRFSVEFVTQAIPASGAGHEGVDIAIRQDDPIGGDRMKGLMRQSAQTLLHLAPTQTDPVFGTRQQPSPWSWNTAEHRPEWIRGARHRVKVDPLTDAVDHGSIASAQNIWTQTWSFSIEQKDYVDPVDLGRHRVVLRAAAAATKHLGMWRRRGYGWVGIQPEEPITDAEIADLIAWRQA